MRKSQRENRRCLWSEVHSRILRGCGGGERGGGAKELALEVSGFRLGLTVAAPRPWGGDLPTVGPSLFKFVPEGEMAPQA